MFKTVTFFKRNPAMSYAEFVERYERVHRRIGERLLIGHVEHYSRRYLHPLPRGGSGVAGEPAYDVATEIWYADRDAYDKVRSLLGQPDAAAEIAEDERIMFDPASSAAFFVEEHVSEMAGG